MEQIRNGRALIGFMDETEAVDFLRGRCILDKGNGEDIHAAWAAAKSAVDALEPASLSPSILDVGPEFKPQLEAVLQDPTFREAVGTNEWSFKQVEIDKLVCFQKYLDTDYSAELAKDLHLTDMARVIELCLPRNPPKRTIGAAFDPNEHSATLFASSMDFRVLGDTRGEDPVTKRRMYGFAVGWGVPFVSVVHLGDRHFLKNGFHRVYLLRERGLTHVPCILLEGKTFADTGAVKAGFFPESLLSSEKPPVFAHYFSNQIAPPLKMRPITKVVRIKADEFVLPVTLQAPPPKREETPQAHVVETPPMDKETEFEDFKIEREGWNVYRLVDGAIIKARQLLVALRKDPSAQMFQPAFSNLLVSVMAPQRLKGTPSSKQYSPQELSAAVTEKSLKYETIMEATNEYITETGIRLTIRLASLDVSGTSKFDASGYPIYLINAQTQIQVIVPGGPV